MNNNNVYLNSDVIEDCLSEAFDVFEKHPDSDIHGNPRKIRETAS
ncbi:hypothetical protein CLHUN_26110 [Ruminiclostridium hungatei]|uniref:Uncharacterized protein n=1 Tax=Ruminiclostridium hungatei TaxID=48256 RepID=A0A1V4SI30_RUMHU|nr:hypothetical protein [Ruminiclostridium hungatei]OPX43464.1 hypothetical protein CLHUN_26110 [Ruminiclostridium hungatei]